MIRESTIEIYLTKKIDLLGGLSFKWTSCCSGVPDRIIIYNSVIYLVELKTSKGVLSKIQKYRFKCIAKCGITVLVLNSINSIDTFIKRIEK